MTDFSENSLLVIQKKYLRRNSKFEIIETPKECFLRVAQAVAQAEETDELKKKWTDKFLKILENLEFLPGGRTLANAGTSNGQLANCFVLPFEDNVEEIFEVVKDSSILKKNGGGVGFSFSKIRPKGDVIAGTTGSACGPVALMKIVDAASEILMQSGGRRSGNMVVLNANHPDIFEFITCKEQNHVLNQINFSIGASDSFMKAVVADKSWDLINPRTGKKTQTVSARSIFELAATYAWKNGDPGIIFLDRINRDNPVPLSGPLTAVNLCGEQPLLPYEACNLGSINLLKFVKPESQAKNLVDKVDWQKLNAVVRVAVRFLDNVISVCKYPLAKVDRVVKANRKIGLGVMGWADMLIALEEPYGSPNALKLAEKIMKQISDISHDESEQLGQEKGSFPAFDGSVWQKKKKKKWMRNATTTTIAPTGSISMVANVSSGIEPLFALSYFKQVFDGTRMPEVNLALLHVLEKEFAGKDQELSRLKNQIIKRGSIKDIKSLSHKIKKVFVTAMDLSFQDHIKTQAAFQKYTDNAVSKTINLPQTSSAQDVQSCLLLAWKLKCKGITVYRDKSREGQVLNVGLNLANEKKYPGKTIVCPECGGELRLEEGCKNCPNCGWSACSL